jgi:hypothetical protein
MHMIDLDSALRVVMEAWFKHVEVSRIIAVC